MPKIEMDSTKCTVILTTSFCFVILLLIRHNGEKHLVDGEKNKCEKERSNGKYREVSLTNSHELGLKPASEQGHSFN